VVQQRALELAREAANERTSKVSRNDMDTMTGTADADSTDVRKGTRRGQLVRYCPVEDMHIVRRAEGDGTGRVVEAYCAVFGQSAEIKDGQGHYEESIDPGAFDRWLSRAQRRPGGLAGSVRVLYNHGKTMEGQPAPEFQRPLGKPLEIVPDSRGLLTRTEYKKSPLADELLDDIKEGRITAQSFEGPDFRSDPALRGPGDRYRARGGVLQRVRRMALGIQNYGPALYAAYQGAEFLGVRMSIPGGDDEDFDTPEFEDETSTDEVLTGLPPEDGTSARYHQHALYVMRSREAREARGITW
jgi:HK97 family phage prohead protease